MIANSIIQKSDANYGWISSIASNDKHFYLADLCQFFGKTR